MPLLLLFLVTVYQTAAPISYPSTDIAANIMTTMPPIRSCSDQFGTGLTCQTIAGIWNPSETGCQWWERAGGGYTSWCTSHIAPTHYVTCEWTLREAPAMAPTRWLAACSQPRGWPSDVAHNCDVDVYPMMARWACLNPITGRRWSGELLSGGAV